MGAPTHVGTVRRVEPLTCDLVRVTLGGPGLAGFEPVAWTDAYVNLLFPPPGAPYEVPFDVAEARSLDRHLWPLPRRFTVRRWDAGRRELAIDFVTHGGAGTAGRWAQQARPGELLQLQGPSGGYLPDPAVGTHLLVGDESALPAIAASLAAVPPGARALVVGLVASMEGELALACSGELSVTWLHRQALDRRAEDALVASVRDLELDPADVQGFVHGEASETRAVRRYLLGELGLARDRLSVSPYWRRTMTEEDWRVVKPDWLAEVDVEI